MAVFDKNIHRQIHYFALLGIVATLPFSILLNSYLIVLLALNWLMEGNFRQKFHLFFSNNKIALFFVGFYVLHIVCYFYSQNTADAAFTLEKKLALLAFPLIFSTSLPLTRLDFENILKIFVASSFMGTAYCFLMAWLKYRQNQNEAYFYYHDLASAIDIHAVYLSLYLAFCIFILVYFSLKNWQQQSALIKTAGFILILLMLIFIFFLASKTILISVFLIVNFALLIFLFKKRMKLVFMLFLSLNLFLPILFFSLPHTKKRFEDIADTNIAFVMKEKYTYEENNSLTGITLRLIQLKFTKEILDENKAWLTGVGIGGSQKFLDQKYAAANLYTGKPGTGDHGYLGYNVHNQYVEHLLRTGLIGFSYFLIYLFLSFRAGFKQKNYLFILFLVLFSIICFSESILEANKGIVFFAFFNSFFIFQENRQKL